MWKEVRHQPPHTSIKTLFTLLKTGSFCYIWVSKVSANEARRKGVAYVTFWLAIVLDLTHPVKENDKSWHHYESVFRGIYWAHRLRRSQNQCQDLQHVHLRVRKNRYNTQIQGQSTSQNGRKWRWKARPNSTSSSNVQSPVHEEAPEMGNDDSYRLIF